MNVIGLSSQTSGKEFVLVIDSLLLTFFRLKIASNFVRTSDNKTFTRRWFLRNINYVNDEYPVWTIVSY